jgi:hypothetical protein
MEIARPAMKSDEATLEGLSSRPGPSMVLTDAAWDLRVLHAAGKIKPTPHRPAERVEPIRRVIIAARCPRSRIAFCSAGSVPTLVTAGDAQAATLPALLGRSAPSCFGRKRVFRLGILAGKRAFRGVLGCATNLSLRP